jgi:hypothetical protein
MPALMQKEAGFSHKARIRDGVRVSLSAYRQRHAFCDQFPDYVITSMTVYIVR